jgi:hypothetical protein
MVGIWAKIKNGFSDWSEINGVTKFNRSFTIKNDGDGYEFV